VRRKVNAMGVKFRSAVLLGAVLLVAWPPGSLAFANVKEGDLLEEEELPGLEGGRLPYLGRGRASVFVFFRPGQDHSLDALRRLAALERELAGRPVRFVAIVSDAWTSDEVRATVRQAGIRMPVLVDRGDALYGKLGVRLHPVIGIADGQHRLAAYEHFRQINLEEILRARIRRVLGEIDDAGLAKALEPARATMPGDDPRFVARRELNLGRLLLERRNFEKALAAARKAQERDPTFAAARTLAGQALAGMGRCAEAVVEFDAALALDPRDGAAAEGKKGCSR